MGISIGGIMRGAFPRLSQRISDVRDNKEAAVLKVGAKFSELKEKVNAADVKNRAYMSNVESVAASMGIDKDIVYNVFKVYGGSNKSSLNHLSNLHKSFISKGKQIPTMAVTQTAKMMPAKEDKAILSGMPPEGEELNAFDKAMSLFKNASADEVFQEFMKRNPQLSEDEVRKIMSNTMNPTYSPSSRIDPKAFASTMGTMKDQKPADKYTLLFNRFKNFDKKIIDSPDMFSDKNTQFIKDLRQPFDLLRQHIDDGDLKKAEQQYNFIIDSGFNNITTTKPEGADKTPNEYVITNQLLRKQMPGMSEEFYKNKTNELMTTKTVRVGNQVFKTIIREGEKVLIPMYSQGADGVDQISNPKIFQENTNLIRKGTQNLQKIFSLRNVLKKYPNAFSFEGKIRMAVGGALDMLGQEDYVKGIGADKIFQSVQDRTSFVSSVKDELFDDPRLSDQDLRLVLNYIAILDNPIVGPVMSRAALIGIEKAMLNSMAVRLAQNYPTLPAFNRVIKDGVSSNSIDFSKDSVAKRMMDNLMVAEYGINYKKDMEVAAKLKNNKHKEFMQSTLTNYQMVKNSLAAVNAYQSYQKTGADDSQFKYKSDNLFNVRDLKEFKDGISIPGVKEAFSIEKHEKRVQELRAEYKEKQRQRKLRLG